MGAWNGSSPPRPLNNDHPSYACHRFLAAFLFCQRACPEPVEGGTVQFPSLLERTPAPADQCPPQKVYIFREMGAFAVL
jgi:hypothetical protein